MLAKKTAELQFCIFTKGQLRKLKSTSNNRILWSVEDIASSISLFSTGPRSYRLLRKRAYPLPGVSTLRRWADKLTSSQVFCRNCKMYILSIILKLVENNSLSKMDKACVVLFDEMKRDTMLSPSKCVEVIMVRGLFGNWRQPIFYDFDCKITQELLFEIIKNLEHIGYPVYAINSDLGHDMVRKSSDEKKYLCICGRASYDKTFKKPILLTQASF